MQLHVAESRFGGEVRRKRSAPLRLQNVSRLDLALRGLSFGEAVGCPAAIEAILFVPQPDHAEPLFLRQLNIVAHRSVGLMIVVERRRAVLAPDREHILPDHVISPCAEHPPAVFQDASAGVGGGVASHSERQPDIDRISFERRKLSLRLPCRRQIISGHQAVPFV